MERWLTEDQASAWLAFRATNTLLSAELDRQLVRDAGMPHAYYAMLAILAMQPDRKLRLIDLAERLNFSQSRLSHAIARMEQSGWVRREPCPTNQRSIYAVLTDAGAAAQSAAAPGHVRTVHELVFDALTDTQVRELRDICQAILAKLAAQSGAGPNGPKS